MIACLHVCPICGGEAPSDHHIIPRAEGGTDDPMNKVWLCLSCHDIVEEIYDRTGRTFSPELVKEIQRSLGVHFVQRAETPGVKGRPLLAAMGEPVLISPGETPWWEITDQRERHKACNRQFMRMWNKNHPEDNAKRLRRRRNNIFFSNLRSKLELDVKAKAVDTTIQHICNLGASQALTTRHL